MNRFLKTYNYRITNNYLVSKFESAVIKLYHFIINVSNNHHQRPYGIRGIVQSVIGYFVEFLE